MLDEHFVTRIFRSVDADEEHVRSRRHFRIHVKHILFPDKGLFQSDARGFNVLHFLGYWLLLLLLHGLLLLHCLLLRFRDGFHYDRRLLVESARIGFSGAGNNGFVRRTANVMIAGEFDGDEVIAW